MVKHTSEKIEQILQEVKQSLKDKKYWNESEAFSRGAKELLRKTVTDKTKLHKIRS